MTWTLDFTRQAKRDASELASAGLARKAQEPPAIREVDPFAHPPPYEKLVGDLTGVSSRRINIRPRLVFHVFEEERAVRILRLCTHCG